MYAEAVLRFCSIQNEPFFISNNIVSNNWNLFVPAQAGTVGLGPNSPIYTMAGQTNTQSGYAI